MSEEGDILSLTLNNHVSMLLDGMWSQYEQGEGTDLSILCEGNHQLKVHRWLIQIFSPHLLEQSTSDVIEIDVEKDILKLIIEFLYKGSVDICEGDIQKLRKAAEVLQMKTLLDVLEKADSMIWNTEGEFEAAPSSEDQFTSVLSGGRGEEEEAEAPTQTTLAAAVNEAIKMPEKLQLTRDKDIVENAALSTDSQKPISIPFRIVYPMSMSGMQPLNIPIKSIQPISMPYRAIQPKASPVKSKIRSPKLPAPLKLRDIQAMFELHSPTKQQDTNSQSSFKATANIPPAPLSPKSALKDISHPDAQHVIIPMSDKFKIPEGTATQSIFKLEKFLAGKSILDLPKGSIILPQGSLQSAGLFNQNAVNISTIAETIQVSESENLDQFSEEQGESESRIDLKNLILYKLERFPKSQAISLENLPVGTIPLEKVSRLNEISSALPSMLSTSQSYERKLKLMNMSKAIGMAKKVMNMSKSAVANTKKVQRIKDNIPKRTNLVGRVKRVTKITSEKELHDYRSRKMIRYLRLNVRCTKCEYVTNDKDEFEQHIIIEHPELDNGIDRTRVRCAECDFSAVHKHALFGHWKTEHKTLEEKKCTLCEFSTTNGKLFKRHMMFTHTTNRPYECSLCDYRGRTKQSYKMHLEIHSNIPYTCEICGKVIKTKTNYHHHKRTHVKPVTYPCPICAFPFRQKPSVNKHLAVVHGMQVQRPEGFTGNPTDFKLSCPLCDYKVAQKVYLLNHLAAVHQVDEQLNRVEPTISCPDCDFMCYINSQLTKHKNEMHRADRPRNTDNPDSLVCVICDKTFKQKLYLQRHIKVMHSLECKMHLCELCGFTTKFKVNLRQHIKKKHLEVC